MPFIAAASKIDLPYKTDQQDAKKQAMDMFSVNFPEAKRLIFAFDNSASGLLPLLSRPLAIYFFVLYLGRRLRS